jgi:hypothetical protein
MGPGVRRDDKLNRHLAVPHRCASGQGFGCVNDGVGVDAVVAVEVGNRAGLPKVLDAERFDAVAADAAEPITATQSCY